MEEQDRTTDSMDSECILPHSPCDESDDEDKKYPMKHEGNTLKIRNTVEEMDSTDVEIKEEVGELYMGNEETHQTVLPSGLILINDQSTVATGETDDVRPGRRQVLTCTSVYNDKNGTPSFLQASQWKCSIVQRNESLRGLEVNEPKEKEGSSEFVRRFSHRVVERMERDPLAISPPEVSSNLSPRRIIPPSTPGTSVAVVRTGIQENPGTPKKHPSTTVKKHFERRRYKCEVEGCNKSYKEHSGLIYHKTTHAAEKPYKCKEKDCNKSFWRKYSLQCHMDTHFGKKYKCDECENEYLHNKSLVYHKDTVHKNDKTEHKCEECGKILATIAALELHMGIHTGDKKYKCLVEGCDKSFASAMGYRVHKNSCHGGKRYKCEECGSEFTLLQTLKNHKKKVHTESPTGFKAHKDSLTGEKMHKCDECENVYLHRKSLTHHKETIHKNNKNKTENKCEECGKVVVSIEALERHMRIIHSGEKKFKCLVKGCDKSFASSIGFKDHKDSYHGGKKYKCEHCEKEYLRRRSMLEHKRIVHAKNPIIYKCEHCEKELSHPRTLKKHKETVHSQNDSIFQCKLCEKSFTQAQRLTDHCTREHSKPEENRLKCSHCDKTFGNERTHKAHIQIHEKRFKCLKCEEAFTSTAKLRSHVIFKHRFDQDVQQTYWQQ